VRIGVGRPPGRQDPADYVLEPVGRIAAEKLGDAVLLGEGAVLHIIEHGIDSAMREFNTRE
jgi:peptidyl-tRNA hydrolase, PTH1 family